MSLTADALFLSALIWCGFWALVAAGSRWMIVALLVLGAVHWTLAQRGFYLNTTSFPPPQALLLIPGLVIIAVFVVSPAGRKWLRKADPVALMALHVLRIPVELVLHRAAQQGLVPMSMTYSGHNFDIVSGVSALFMTAWLLSRNPPSRTVVLAWNLVCLVLLLVVVITAVGAIPSSVQRWSFNDPNVLVLRAPWVLLPAVIVPTVLWAHVASLVQLLRPSARAVGARGHQE